MHFTTLLIAGFTALTSTTTVAAADATTFVNATVSSSLSASLTEANHWGAPIPPWEKGCQPGWYYGDYPWDILDIVIPWLKDSLICEILDLLPLCLHCPKPKPSPSPPTQPGQPGDGWTVTFTGLDAAVQADDYLTYGLVDTVADCETMCEGVSGCTFFNTYHDVNGKNGSPQLTCALFSKCHTAADADNKGGQTQPDGSVDYITDSAGYCKSS